MANGEQLPRGFAWEALVRLAIPMIISRAGLAAMGIADAVMVARFEAREFAWLSLAEGMMGRLLDVAAAFLIGGLVLVSRHFSRGDETGARGIWLRTVPVAVMLGALVLVCGTLGQVWLPWMGQKQDLVSHASPVMAILGAGVPFALVAISAAIYLEGINRPRFVAISVVMANILNIALNWLLIGGHWGLPAMGARGSALSTTFVRSALGIGLLAYAWRLHRDRKRDDSDIHRAEREATRRMQWRLGGGAALTVAATATLTAPLTLIAARLGILPLATFSAAWSLAGPAILVALGLADAAGNYVSAEAGRAELRDAARVAWGSLRLTVIPLVVAAAIFCIWPAQCAALYTNDSALRVSMAKALPWIALIVLVDGCGFVMVASLRALREAAWPTGIEIGSMLLLVPLAFGLTRQGGYEVQGLFLAMLASAIVRASLLTWRFWWHTTTPSTAAQDGSIEIRSLG